MSLKQLSFSRKKEITFQIRYINKDWRLVCKEHRSCFYVVTDSDCFQLNFFSSQLKRLLQNQWNQWSSQFTLVIKAGKNNGLTIFLIQLCLGRYFSQRDMAINFLWKEIWVGKEMAALANKCCLSNPLMLSDDLSPFESFGLLYQRKCIIPWSCVKFFSKSHL